MERSQQQGYREDVHQGRRHQIYSLRALFTAAAAGVWRNRWANFTFMLQIKNLKETESYVFRVRAQNKAGVGKTSDVTEAVTAVTKPGERKMSWS